MSNDKKTIFIFGLGFSGRVLARLLLEDGWSVRASTRSGIIGAGIIGAEIIGAEIISPDTAGLDGVEGFAFADDAPLADVGAALDGVTHILSTIPVIGGTDPVLKAHGTALDSLHASGCWMGYVSATSVYTEANGGWVTEDSPTEPRSKRGQWRRHAEKNWQERLSAEVFRAAGIYGPGRSPFKDLLQAAPKRRGRIISKPGHEFNRIHVDDMARVLRAAMLKPRGNRVLNLADGTPSEAGEVIRYAAELLGVAPPAPIAFEDAELSPMARSFYATSRKVNNHRIKDELGIDLLYPNYRAGMAAVLEAERKMGII